MASTKQDEFFTLPPMQIHISSGGRQLGPFSLEETRQRLTAGEFQISDLAWCEAQPGWVPLATLPGFAPAPAPAGPPAFPPQLPVAAGRPPGMPARMTQSPVAIGVPPPTSGLATASLVCGILSVTLIPCVSAIAAVICGHMAQAQIKKAAGTVGGSGMALAGLIMGYASFALIPIIAILAGIALPVFSEVQIRGLETKALSNGKQIATACKIYAMDNKGNFPPTLEALVPDYISERSVFICPFDPAEPFGYTFYPGKETDPATNVLLVSKSLSKRKRRVVVHVDGTGNIEPATTALPLPR